MPESVLTPAPERTNSRGYCCVKLCRSLNARYPAEVTLTCSWPLNFEQFLLEPTFTSPESRRNVSLLLPNQQSSCNLILRIGAATDGLLTHTLGLHLCLVELGAPERDILWRETLDVAVIEPPVGAGAPSQRRLHGRPCGRRGFENPQRQVEREDLRLAVPRPTAAVTKREVGGQKAGP